MSKNYTDELKNLFIDTYQKVMIENGATPAPRAVFRKQHGVLYGKIQFTNTIKNLPELIKSNVDLGIFSLNTNHNCLLRFSSDIAPNGTDVKSTIGVGLKIFDLPTDAKDFEGPNTDFIFQNIDRFFAKDSKQMANFTIMSSYHDKQKEKNFYKNNPGVKEILEEMEHYADSCLTATYWPIIPFKLGNDYMIKLRLRPQFIEEYPIVMKQKDYLKIDLAQRLSKSDYTYVLEGQITKYDEKLADNLHAVWKEEFHEIAILTLPKQDLHQRGLKELGENINYNCWRINSKNQPLGSIAESRRDVYKYGAETRYSANGLEFREPSKPVCPFHHDSPHTKNDDIIVSAAIYPPIGVMRVGNSKEHYVGPLVPEPDPTLGIDTYRDTYGKIKRQAAEFRIYGLNSKGEIVKELSNEKNDTVDIEWSCHLANQKAAWYQFNLALDIPEANLEKYKYSYLRNSDIEDRKKLVIDGGKQTIGGKQTKIEFNGKFSIKNKSKNVYLGEMFFAPKTKRLHVLGGLGKAQSIDGFDVLAVDFANNDKWYDDTSDGPITATVKYLGKKLDVKPAWVICAPPDYAPMQQSVRTMWDLMRDLAVKNLKLPAPSTPSFTYDIFPIFKRMTDLQWVNKGFMETFGINGAYNFIDSEWVIKLRNSSINNLEFRRQMFNQFRQFELPGSQSPALWPWLYGDAIEVPAEGSPRQHSTLTDLQISMLQQWVDGNFNDDWEEHKEKFKKPKSIEEYPIKEHGDILTRAAMDFCLADAFHPGCEMTWPMRLSSMYSEPFRLNHSDKAIEDELNYGPFITQNLLTSIVNPFEEQVPGGITRWMAIPWQTDTSSCKDGYVNEYDPYIPTFWPACVPNEVITYTQFLKLKNSENSEKTEIFNQRSEWLEDLPGKPTIYSPYQEIINKMIRHFDSVGTVLPLELSVGNKNELTQSVQVAMTSEYTYLLNRIAKKLGEDTEINSKDVEKAIKSELNSTKFSMDTIESSLKVNKDQFITEFIKELDSMKTSIEKEYIKSNEKVITIHERFRQGFK